MSRRLKILVALLVLSNIGVGASAFYSIRVIDRKYSALVAGAIPALNDLQTLTARAVDAMRQTNPSIIGPAPVAREAIERAERAISTDRELRHDLLRRSALRRNCEQRQTFERAGEDFTRAANDYIAALEDAPDAAQVTRRRDEILRPVFDRYLLATTNFADEVQAESLRTSGRLTASTENLARGLLAAANWPLAVLLLLFVTSLVVLLFVARSSLFMKEEHWRT